MALFAKERDAKERTHEVIPATPASGARAGGIAPQEVAMGERDRMIMGQSPGTGGIDAFLGKGTRVTGKLVFEGTGRIEGQVEGEISAQETLTIGEGAVVKATIAGATIVIEGRVTGDVTAHHRVELRASSRVQGNITAPSLIVHEGAFFEGQCSMAGAEATAMRDKPEAMAAFNQARRPRDIPAAATAATPAA
ncbi:MAG: polymer-forming cytoskeletal protein [Deltaproteobacteria bacterium]|nr:MAG: polymer-forming cytoskeletal protein [Deltaproteobacteria bacterium]